MPWTEKESMGQRGSRAMRRGGGLFPVNGERNGQQIALSTRARGPENGGFGKRSFPLKNLDKKIGGKLYFCRANKRGTKGRRKNTQLNQFDICGNARGGLKAEVGRKGFPNGRGGQNQGGGEGIEWVEGKAVGCSR